MLIINIVSFDELYSEKNHEREHKEHNQDNVWEDDSVCPCGLANFHVEPVYVCRVTCILNLNLHSFKHKGFGVWQVLFIDVILKVLKLEGNKSISWERSIVKVQLIVSDKLIADINLRIIDEGYFSSDLVQLISFLYIQQVKNHFLVQVCL
jgi:hypothetical protein